MATLPLEFNLTSAVKCHSCGSADNVLLSNVKSFPPTCVVCLFRKIDVVMEWRLSNTAIQTLAHRAHSLDIRDEQERMEAQLPPELRRKKK